MTVIVQDEFSPKLPLVFRWTLPTAYTLNEFELFTAIKKISIRFETNTGYFTFLGTDGELGPAHYGSVDPDAWLELNLTIDGHTNFARSSIYLAADTDNTVVQILLEG
jgi:hypothetical protein